MNINSQVFVPSWHANYTNNWSTIRRPNQTSAPTYNVIPISYNLIPLTQINTFTLPTPAVTIKNNNCHYYQYNNCNNYYSRPVYCNSLRYIQCSEPTYEKITIDKTNEVKPKISDGTNVQNSNGTTKTNNIEPSSPKKDKGKVIQKNRNQTATLNKNVRSTSVNKTHKWLTTNLKGHINEINDMEFSSNGKYLASCAEADISKLIPKQRKLQALSRHRNSTSSDNSSSNEDISSPQPAKKSPVKSPRNRRQRSKAIKHVTEIDDDSSNKENDNTKPNGAIVKPNQKNIRSRNNNKTVTSSASSSPLHSSSASSIGKTEVQPPLKEIINEKLPEGNLADFIHMLLVPQQSLRKYGFPVENAFHNGYVEIFKQNMNPRSRTSFEDSYLQKLISSDSGQGSGSSSPRFDSDTSEEEIMHKKRLYNYNYYNSSTEKQCSRCKKEFVVNENGEYITKDACLYHWGKLDQQITNNIMSTKFTCCNGDSQSQGCSHNYRHVWTGVTTGLNGPYTGYVRTNFNDDTSEDEEICDVEREINNKVYALDCEMCYTAFGLEATKVTVVNDQGQMVYETFIRPESQIIDYNTKFSGIYEKDIYGKNNKAKPLIDVQKDLLTFIKSDTVLVGHGLENDLRVLKIIHKNIVDTTVLFPHPMGFPYRRGLKTLMKTLLNRDIQIGSHDSLEDSRACLELAIYKLRKSLEKSLS